MGRAGMGSQGTMGDLVDPTTPVAKSEGAPLLPTLKMQRD